MYMCIHTSTVIHPRACLAGNTQAGLKVSLQYNKLAILRSRFFLLWHLYVIVILHNIASKIRKYEFISSVCLGIDNFIFGAKLSHAAMYQNRVAIGPLSSGNTIQVL